MIKMIALQNIQWGVILGIGGINYELGDNEIQIPMKSFNLPEFERKDQVYYDKAEPIMADRIKLKSATMLLNAYKKMTGRKILQELASPYVLKNIVTNNTTLVQVRNELIRLKALILAATDIAGVDAAYDSMNYPNGEL